ncbi:hypothetical protein Hanom_Chr02g00116231 [Helianthus anomalus]
MFRSNFRRCPFGQKFTGSVLYLSKSCTFCPLGQTWLEISVKKCHTKRLCEKASQEIWFAGVSPRKLFSNSLLRNEADQKIVSRDKRDKRDFEQISNLATRMGLFWYLTLKLCLFFPSLTPLIIGCSFSESYGKVVVASKVPLPHYMPDLDADKRPQREVKLICSFFPYTFHTCPILMISVPKVVVSRRN